ncbi:MAG TPA: tetratricopeptide repeat protein [Myxococcota bacterium]|nr:tetratricopeptide repeat protein [Myxococcota bacterium]
MNKRKILESAQKHLQRGALDKALEDYQTLLKADPKDSNIRLKVGDLHLKLGRNQDAIDAYLRVAQQFTTEGFDAKAVALYKQVTKLDEKRFEVHAQLGDLYQRMGLTSEAMRAMQLASDGAYRAGDKGEALGLLRRMAALEPSNTANRLKVADLLRAEGKPEDALAEYDEVVKELERQRNTEEQVKVLERALELAPDRASTLRSLARASLEANAFAKAESASRKLLAAAAEDVEAIELLGRALEGAGRAAEAADAFRSLAEKFRARGEEDRARELIQRYGAAEAAFDAGEPEPDVLEGDSSDLELDPELDASLGLAGGELEVENNAGEALETTQASLPLTVEATEAPAETTETSGDAPVDLDQLLAEASVFTRYGKHERAIETLRAALRVEPGHPLALERLGEALIALGNKPHASSALQRAAAAYANAADAAGVARVRALLAPIDRKAAEAIALPEIPAAPASSAEPEPSDSSDAELDVEIDPGLDDDTPMPRSERSEPLADGAADFSGIEIDTSGIAAGSELVSEKDAAAAVVSADSLEDSSAFTFDQAKEAKAPKRDADQTSTSSSSVEADFEEAEFYREQGLKDEARALYERVLSAVPNHPRAMLRLGELDGPAKASQAAPAEAPAGPAGGTFDLDLDLDVGEEPEENAPVADEPPLAPAVRPAPPPPPRPPPEAVAQAPTKPAPPPASKQAPPQPAAPAPPLDLQPLAPVGAADFDLAAELSEAFGDSAPPAQDGASGDAFREVFAAFKAGVKREVSEGDYEAHFDLGIAYKEMGLIEDALGEFAAALGSPGRKLACLHLMGTCALDLGRAADAVAHLSEALSGAALPPQQEAALRVDLGRAHRAAGDAPRARAEFESAHALDASVADVEQLLAELESAPAEEPAGEAGEALESFDDLMEESSVENAAAQPAAPAYESFDDLHSDASDVAPAEEAEPLAEEPEPEPRARPAARRAAPPPPSEPEPEGDEPEPSPPARPAQPSSPSPAPASGAPAAAARRKKKISFV